LAIIVSVLLFSVLPLLQTGIILALDWRLRQAQVDLNGEQAIFGGDFRGVSDLTLIFQGVSGMVFLIIAVLAWRGRPTWGRVALIAAVIGLTAVTAFNTINGLTAQPDAGAGIDSGAGLVQQLLCGRLAFTFVIPLYVLWYMNRAPARAFYRDAARAG
jgi:hypothetical protein